MKKYNVPVKCTFEYCIDVDANSPDEAYEKAMNMVNEPETRIPMSEMVNSDGCDDYEVDDANITDITNLTKK